MKPSISVQEIVGHRKTRRLPVYGCSPGIVRFSRLAPAALLVEADAEERRSFLRHARDRALSLQVAVNARQFTVQLGREIEGQGALARPAPAAGAAAQRLR